VKNDYAPFIKALPTYFTPCETRILSNDKAITFEQYCEIDALNASVLKKPTPAHMLHTITEDEDEEEKLHFKIGRLVHMAALEPEQFYGHVLKLPSDAPKKPTKAQVNAKRPSVETIENIDWWERFRAESEGRTVVKEDELDSIEQMRDALLRHHQIREMLQCASRKEATIEVWDEEMQIRRKARYDLLPGAGADFLLDIKTTRKELDMNAIKYEILGRGYHLQAQYYIDTLNLASNDKRKRFYFPFVKSSPPYVARLAWVDAKDPGEDSPLAKAKALLYASDVGPNSPLPLGRMPMFINAARECLRRICENHADPMGAWEAYEFEGPQLVY